MRPNGREGEMSLAVTLVESLGSENILHLEKGGISIKARTAPDVVFPEGSKVCTTFDINGMRLFDRQTERAIAEEG